MAITVETIKNALVTSNQAVVKGILYLHSQQTADEQESKDTAYKNHRGFKVSHAKRGSELAEKIMAGESLSMAELCEASAICMEYANTQLLDLARRVHGCN